MPTQEQLENVRNAQNLLDDIEEQIRNERTMHGRYSVRLLGLKSLLSVAKASLFEAKLDAGMMPEKMNKKRTVEDHSEDLRKQRQEAKKSRPRFSSH
jgi:hypothetical protein